jgi:hypothetical protein
MSAGLLQWRSSEIEPSLGGGGVEIENDSNTPSRENPTACQLGFLQTKTATERIPEAVMKGMVKSLGFEESLAQTLNPVAVFPLAALP